jgi:Glycosyltransferases, probably involved in cell wall biogenesis
MAACMRVSRRAGERRAAIMSYEARPPLVSIVTPSYNQGRFIRRTIESVLSQSYPFIEYVVVDGRSTDETVDILKSYGSRLKWISEEDRGQTHAINKGMDMVSGEILAYLNSDDVLAPDAVAKAVRYFDQHPTCSMI